MLISNGIESIAGANRIERLVNTFELIHAASSPNDTKTKYADDLVIFLAEARAVDVNDLNIDPKGVYPANLNGESLQHAYDLYGDKVKTFVDKHGKFYVRRPSSKEYYQSVRDDKPAGLHEQKKIDEVLGCGITIGEVVSNEQQCILKRANGSSISFVIKDNLDGTKHAKILVDGKSISINTNSQNKNDCYYNVALVANEMSQGKIYDEARKIVDNNNVVKELRNCVSLAMKNDEKLLKEFRWTNRTDLKSYFISLTGYYVDDEGQLGTDGDNITYFRTKFATANLPKKYSEMKDRKGIDDMGNEVPLADHHLKSQADIRLELGILILSLSDEQLESTLEAYLNDSSNASNKAFV
ncbi:unnamed protein product, partial [Didymodactylos carnosus]